MPLYVYALCDSAEIVVPEDKDLIQIPCLEGVAVCRKTQIDLSAPEKITQEAIFYEELITSLAQQTTILPMRFPTTLQDEKKFELWVKEHAFDIKKQWQLLANKVEYSVYVEQKTLAKYEITATIPIIEALPNQTIKQYLQKKMVQHQAEYEQEKIVEIFLNSYLPMLVVHSVRHEVLKKKREDRVWEAVFLVDVQNLPTFVASLESTPLSYSGPWACYHFSTF